MTLEQASQIIPENVLRGSQDKKCNSEEYRLAVAWIRNSKNWITLSERYNVPASIASMAYHLPPRDIFFEAGNWYYRPQRGYPDSQPYWQNEPVALLRIWGQPEFIVTKKTASKNRSRKEYFRLMSI